MSTLIYFHGFLSSPKSKKAQQTKAWLATNYPEWRFECPQLSPCTSQAKASIEALLKSISGKKYLIGSSLGGFWSTWAIENHLAQKAVLINPAVKPFRRFRMSLGETFQHFYSEESYTMNAQDLDDLEACSVENIQFPNHYWVLLQKGDEILDYTFAEKYYAESRKLIEPGGNHSFIGYERHLPAIIGFFNE